MKTGIPMRKKIRLTPKKGLTFLEIMIAMVIMATALLPIFSMINKGTEDTDLNHATAYAVGRASDILNTMLDSIPFEALRQGSPGLLSTEDLADDTTSTAYPKGKFPDYNGRLGKPKLPADLGKTLALQLFGTGGPAPSDIGNGKKGYPCGGYITDPRGIKYRIQLLVEDLGDYQPRSFKPEEKLKSVGPFTPLNEVTMSFLQNPKVLSDPTWVASYQTKTNNITKTEGPRFELEAQTTNNIGKDGIAVPPTVAKYSGWNNVYDADDFKDPTQIRMVAHHVADRNRYAPEPTTTPTPSNIVEFEAYCVLKRLIVEVQWCMDKKYFGDPDTQDVKANIQRIHLMTLKGDVAK